MARSYGVLKVSVWEPGSEFRALTAAAQWAYVMLLSQPQLSNLGVLPYTPEKWCRFAAAMTVDQLEEAIDELAEHEFVIVDIRVGELLVRTFIKHDKVWSQPKLVTNARKLIREVESEAIRVYLTTRHPWLLDDRPKPDIEAYEAAHETPTERGIETPSDTPFQGAAETPLETPSDTPTERGNRTRARARVLVSGPGVGAAADEKQQPSTEASYAAANGQTDQQPAAAEPPEAPRATTIRQAVEQLADHDQGTLAQIEPLAAAVPAPIFEQVVERHRERVTAGTVTNQTGLFIDLLRRAARDYARAVQHAHAEQHATTSPTDDVVNDARLYARRDIPWNAAEYLIDRKLTRRGVHGDERIAAIEAAADAHREAAQSTANVP